MLEFGPPKMYRNARGCRSQTALEPADAPGRAAVGERIGHHRAARLPLQAIVTHRDGSIQGRLDVALLDDVFGAICVIGPGTGDSLEL